MYTQVDKTKECKSRSIGNTVAQKKSNVKQKFRFIDKRPISQAQKKLQGKIDTVQKKGKYKPTVTIEKVGSTDIAELEWGQGTEISFTAISSCIALIGRKGTDVIGVHIPLKDGDGTFVNDADLESLSKSIATILTGCKPIYYVGEKTVWQGSNATAALTEVTSSAKLIYAGSGKFSAKPDATDSDEIEIALDGKKIWPVLL